MTKEEFELCVTNQQKKLYISALSVVRNTEDAKDAVASAVAHAWEKLDSLRDEDKFDAWLLKITYNEAKRIYRKSREYEDIAELKDSFSYDADKSSLEFFDILSSAKLDGKSRQIIVLRFFYGYELPEIAKIMSIPQSTVKTKYYRALDKIGKMPGLR